MASFDIDQLVSTTVSSVRHAYKDLFEIDGRKVPLEQIITEILKKIIADAEDVKLVELKGTLDGRILGVMSDGSEIELDTSPLPEFTDENTAKLNLDSERIWLASGNNTMGYIKGTMILNRE